MNNIVDARKTVRSHSVHFISNFSFLIENMNNKINADRNNKICYNYMLGTLHKHIVHLFLHDPTKYEVEEKIGKSEVESKN